MKWLVKLFCPSTSSLADMAADKLAAAINGTGKAEAIAKYSAIANNIATYGQNLSAMLLDGSIDENEKADIAKMMKPLFDKVMELV